MKVRPGRRWAYAPIGTGKRIKKNQQLLRTERQNSIAATQLLVLPGFSAAC